MIKVGQALRAWVQQSPQSMAPAGSAGSAGAMPTAGGRLGGQTVRVPVSHVAPPLRRGAAPGPVTTATRGAAQAAAKTVSAAIRRSADFDAVAPAAQTERVLAKAYAQGLLSKAEVGQLGAIALQLAVRGQDPQASLEQWAASVLRDPRWSSPEGVLEIRGVVHAMVHAVYEALQATEPARAGTDLRQAAIGLVARAIPQPAQGGGPGRTPGHDGGGAGPGWRMRPAEQVAADRHNTIQRLFAEALDEERLAG